MKEMVGPAFGSQQRKRDFFITGWNNGSIPKDGSDNDDITKAIKRRTTGQCSKSTWHTILVHNIMNCILQLYCTGRKPVIPPAVLQANEIIQAEQRRHRVVLKSLV